MAEAVKLELFEKYNLKGALRSPAHITLHRPFEFRTTNEIHLIETLKQFQYQSFTIELSGIDAFVPRVIFIDVKPNPELIVLHQALCRHAKRQLQLFNEADDLRGFHPHVTLAFRDLKKNKFDSVYDFVKTKPFEMRFPLEKIALLKLGKTWEVLELF